MKRKTIKGVDMNNRIGFFIFYFLFFFSIFLMIVNVIYIEKILISKNKKEYEYKSGEIIQFSLEKKHIPRMRDYQFKLFFSYPNSKAVFFQIVDTRRLLEELNWENQTIGTYYHSSLSNMDTIRTFGLSLNEETIISFENSAHGKREFIYKKRGGYYYLSYVLWIIILGIWILILQKLARLFFMKS